MDTDLQERLWDYLAWRTSLRFQQFTAQELRERLESFLAWLLDARWFPETDSDEKKRRKRELRKVRAIIARMKAFSENIADVRLQRGLAEWQNYEGTSAVLANQVIRRSPHTQITAINKGSPEIARRYLGAVLIVRKLYPDRSAYEEIQRRLARPELLPDPFKRAIPVRQHHVSLKALQSSVARLQEERGTCAFMGERNTLEQLYAEFLWCQWGQAGYSDAEAEMLRALVQPDAIG
jgi:hypothetical protein